MAAQMVGTKAGLTVEKWVVSVRRMADKKVALMEPCSAALRVAKLVVWMAEMKAILMVGHWAAKMVSRRVDMMAPVRAGSKVEWTVAWMVPRMAGLWASY
jgi:hypothetical protein